MNGLVLADIGKTLAELCMPLVVMAYFVIPGLLFMLPGFLLTVVVLLILTRSAKFLGLVDEPGGRHLHVRPTPKVGGLAIVMGAMLTLIVIPHQEFDLRVLWGGLAICGVGLVDDYLRDGFPWRVKLLCQCAVAVWFAYPYGMPGAFWVTALLIACVNAMNFMDHANGVMAMAAMPAIVFLPGLTSAVFGGAVVAFLLFNFTGRVFAGDAGSHFLGFVLAASALVYEPEAFGNPQIVKTPNFALALLVLTLPLSDAAFVCFLRFCKKTPPWISTPDHLDHRLRRRRAVPMSGMLGAFVSSSAFLLLYFESKLFHTDASFAFLSVVISWMVVLAGAPPLATAVAPSAEPQNLPAPVET